MEKEKVDKIIKQFDETFKIYNNSYETEGKFRGGVRYLSFPTKFEARDIKQFIRKILRNY